MMPLLFLFFGDLIDGFIGGAKGAECQALVGDPTALNACLAAAGIDANYDLVRDNLYGIYRMS